MRTLTAFLTSTALTLALSGAALADGVARHVNHIKCQAQCRAAFALCQSGDGFGNGLKRWPPNPRPRGIAQRIHTAHMVCVVVGDQNIA